MMSFLRKSIMIVVIIMLSVLIISCDSATTTAYPYPDEIHELYNIDLYDVSVTEVNDGSTNLIYIFRDKDDSTIVSLVYEVQTQGYVDPIVMLIAINSDYTIEGYYVTEHNESERFGATIVNNDFGVTNITDLSEFDIVSGVTFTSLDIEECFLIVQDRIADDLKS